MINFFLDVDGVLLDFEDGFRLMLEEQYKEIYNPELTPEQMIQGVSDPAKRFAIFRKFMGSDYFSKLSPLVDQEDYKKVLGWGKIYLVTNIPPAAVPLRVKNLERLGLSFEKIFTGGFETYGSSNYPLKSTVINEIHSSRDEGYFLDDMFENCQDISFKSPNVTPVHLSSDLESVLFDRVENFKGFVRFIENRRNSQELTGQ